MTKKASPKESTELSLPERASVALNSSETEKRLTELSTEFKSITAITNKDGRAECHTALMVLVNARTTIEKTAKAAREDATKFSKAVIAEEKRLIDIVAAEETRLAALRDAWDEKKEQERREAEEAERQRVEAIQSQIRDIKAIPYQFVGASLEEIQGRIELMEAETPDPEYFGDLLMDAKIAHKDSLHALRTRYTQKQQEIEAEAKAEAERVALEEQRAEQARVAAEQEAARLAILADQQRIADEQAAAQAAIKAQQDALAEQQAEIQRQADALAAKQEEANKPAVTDFPDEGFADAIGLPVEQVVAVELTIQNMNAEEILDHVYLPTNVELYTYLHTCTMEKYGLDKAEARRIIIEMAKAMKT